MGPVLNRRRRVLVDRKVQNALGMRIGLHWGIFISLAVTITTLIRIVNNMEQLSRKELIQSTLQDQLVMVAVVTALLPWFIHDSLKLSNRLAGPMLRLRRYIRQLKNGNEVPPIQFRKGDFWDDLPVDFNQLIETVMQDRQELATLRAELKVRTEGLPAEPVPTVGFGLGDTTASNTSMPAR